MQLKLGDRLNPINHQTICPLCNTGIEDEEHFLMNCIAYWDPRRDLFNELNTETNLFLDSMNPSTAFAKLISMKQGEKTPKMMAQKRKMR